MITKHTRLGSVAGWRGVRKSKRPDRDACVECALEATVKGMPHDTLGGIRVLNSLKDIIDGHRE